MSHLKTLNAPKSWPIQRKGIKFIAKPLPGPHKLKDCITINIILKNVLKYTKTSKETKHIINKGEFLVNNIPRKKPAFTVGIMDTISLPALNEYYLVLYDEKGKFILKKITKEQTKQKLCKITGKTILKGKKTQLNFNDGTNLITPKDTYKVGDSVVLENKKIKEHFKLEKGAKIYLTAGKHIGSYGELISIKKFQGISPDLVKFKLNKETVETTKDYVFVVKK